MRASKRTVLLIIGALFIFTANAKPVEVWLTPERLAALKRVAERPRVTKREQLPGGEVVYTWTNSVHGFSTTQVVQNAFGKTAKSAWAEKLDAEKFEKERIIQEIKAIKDRPTAKALDNILKNHEDREATPIEFRFGRDTSRLVY